MTDRSAGDPASGSWHLDKRVPLALIVTIALQTAGAFYWAGVINRRVEHVEDRLERIETTIGVQRHEARISVIESNISGIRVTLNRMEAKIDQLADRQHAAP